MESEESEEEKTRREEVEEIVKEELIKVLRKLKKAKTPGEDEIEYEAWRFTSKEIGKEYWKMIKRIWKGEGIPLDWNKGLICPIYEREDKEKIKNYRGITLMDTAYKIYATILNRKSEGKAEGRTVWIQKRKRNDGYSL